MKEIEVKILEVNPRLMKRKLKELGAKRVFSGNMLAIYYDTKRKTIAKNAQVLRLRSKKNKVELTFKTSEASKSNAKVCEETECHVDDFKAMDKILRSLGFKAARVVRKHRLSFKLDKLSFEIDTYPGVPPLLEIEASTITDLRKAVKMLGFKMSETVSWNSFQVLEHYRKNR